MTFDLAIFLVALALIFYGVAVAASPALACATLGGILLAVVVLSRLVARRPVE